MAQPDDTSGLPSPPSPGQRRRLPRFLLTAFVPDTDVLRAARADRRVLLILLGTLVLSLGAGFGWYRLQTYLDRQHGLDLADNGHFDQAEPLLRRAVARNAEDAEVNRALALGYLAQKEGGPLLTEVEPLVTRWCRLLPEDPEPYRVRMELWLRLGRYAPALADGEHLLELDPDDDVAREQVAGLLAAAGRFGEAERECRRCLEGQPGSPSLRYLLADLYHVRGDRARAAAVLDPLVREHPRFAAALLLRAVLCGEANHPAEAIPLLRRVIALDPSRRKPALYHLSLALKQTGRQAEAQRIMHDLREAQAADRLAVDSEQQPDNLELRFRAAEALLRGGERERGMRLLQEVLDREPANADARRLLAECQRSDETLYPYPRPGTVR